MDPPQSGTPIVPFKPIDFEAYPIVSQATVEHLRNSLRQCELMRDHILQQSADLIAQSRSFDLPKSSIPPATGATKLQQSSGSARHPSLQQKPSGFTKCSPSFELEPVAPSGNCGSSSHAHKMSGSLVHQPNLTGTKSPASPANCLSPVRDASHSSSRKRRSSQVDQRPLTPPKKHNSSPGAAPPKASAIDHLIYDTPSTDWKKPSPEDIRHFKPEHQLVAACPSDLTIHGEDSKVRLPSETRQAYSGSPSPDDSAEIFLGTDVGGSPLFTSSRNTFPATQPSVDEHPELSVFLADEKPIDPPVPTRPPPPSTIGRAPASAPIALQAKPQPSSTKQLFIPKATPATRKPRQITSPVSKRSSLKNVPAIRPCITNKQQQSKPNDARRVPSLKSEKRVQILDQTKILNQNNPPNPLSHHNETWETMSKNPHLRQKRVQMLFEPTILNENDPPNPLSHHNETWEAMPQDTHLRRQSIDFDQENCKTDKAMAPQFLKPLSVYPPEPFPPIQKPQAPLIEFDKLPPLGRRLEAAMEAHVSSWPVRQLVMAMNQIVSYRIEVLGWPSMVAHQPIPIEDLRAALHATNPDKTLHIIMACRKKNPHCVAFTDIFSQQSVQNRLLIAGHGLNTTVQLKRDFTRIGLTYFPMIRTLRELYLKNRRVAEWGEFRDTFEARQLSTPNSVVPSVLVDGAANLQKYAQAAANDGIVDIIQNGFIVAHHKLDGHALDKLVRISLKSEWWSASNPYYVPPEIAMLPNQEKGHLNRFCPKLFQPQQTLHQHQKEEEEHKLQQEQEEEDSYSYEEYDSLYDEEYKPYHDESDDPE
ncbi:uncharacterized protein PGTG_15409 [Puccinia graminis f. sp. tritici CRL 75-36-700-3]|uniref:Uncharacterized protein n=1 Tax=Puccinia graminis f. sp. tritici (strain CRL 75-36-700-3 / race SCCL) TaxID=418459 RepID=E3KZM8_PUCGT|nr:uncharacterized protein PGTG_15409 [Puccinia graminis f. sp. tritici CRL 75-36-700-3]EFP89753.2 hypothetical protein PGTG_15409 [Puccinia graminis f. sp. tritici CRL 75-36-700-3]